MGNGPARARPPARRPADEPRRQADAASARAAALGLPPEAGNRVIARWARTLSRDLKEKTEPKRITVYLADPTPPPIEAEKRVSPENRRLAKLIDEADKLKNEQLRNRIGEIGAAAVGSVDDAQRAAQEELYALEFVAKHRRLAPPEPNYSGHKASTKRLNVRALIEKGVRETGSFEKAMTTFSHTREVESDVEYFETEAARFAKEFTRQARQNAERILKGSYAAIRGVFESYGIRGDAAWYHAMEVRKGANLEAEAEAMVKQAAKEAVEKGEAGARYAERRGSLRNTVKDLRAKQKKIADAIKAYEDHWTQSASPPSDATVAKGQELASVVHAARRELRLAWLKAEAAHPLLAAYRESGDLEKADLSTLDQDVEERMKAVAVKLLPKIIDIDHVHRLITSNQLSPLALPPVVALTRANMFVPDGSLRAGVVNDLAVAAQSKESWILQAAAIALALVFLIPSGGSSLGIAAAGIAGAGLATYAGVREWERYKLQKRLYNTDLDVARALATEEPSLTSFALSLVALGMEGVPLVGAFARARRLKKLVDAGDEASEAARRAVTELDALGKPHGRSDLGRRTLADLNAGRKPPAPKVKVPLRDPELAQSAQTVSYATHAELKKGLAADLRGLKHGTAVPNPDMTWVRGVLRNAPDTSTNWELLKVLGPSHKTIRDPDAVADFAAHIWAYAGERQITARRALVEIVSGATTPTQVKGNLERSHLLKDPPFVDLNFLPGDPHGRYTHLFMEGLISHVHGPGAGRRLRHLVARATGPQGVRRRKKEFWETVWDAMFDDETGKHINRPEMLAPLLQKHLGLPL